MKNAVATVQILIRIAGIIMLILGLAFWGGLSPTLINIHIVVGGVLVLLMWGLAYLAARAGAPTSLVILDVAWSLVLPALGMTQAQLLLGPAHWVIHVIHLLVGIGALGQAEMLAGRAKSSLEAKRPVRRSAQRA